MSCSFIVYLVLTGLKALAVASLGFSMDTSSFGEEGVLWGKCSVSFFSVLIREGVELRTAQESEKQEVKTRQGQRYMKSSSNSLSFKKGKRKLDNHAWQNIFHFIEEPTRLRKLN